MLPSLHSGELKDVGREEKEEPSYVNRLLERLCFECCDMKTDTSQYSWIVMVNWDWEANPESRDAIWSF